MMHACFVSSLFRPRNWKELFVSFRDEQHFKSEFQVCLVLVYGSACSLSRLEKETDSLHVSGLCVFTCMHVCA